MDGEKVDKTDIGEDKIQANRYGGLIIWPNLVTLSGRVTIFSLVISSVMVIFSVEVSRLGADGCVISSFEDVFNVCKNSLDKWLVLEEGAF